MSVPSVIFADASWYGSLRGGVKFGGGGDAQFHDAASRWGIKGSNELSEGLTAVYRFEHKISTANAGQPGGRLAYVGLSGGFGNLSLGQVGNASYGATGAIVDNSGIWGNAYTGGNADGTSRTGNAISYAISTGGVSAQLDAIMDDRNSGNAVDELQLGLSLNLGDVGKLAFAHVQTEDHMVQGPAMYKIVGGTPAKYEVVPGRNVEYSLTGGKVEYNPIKLDAVTPDPNQSTGAVAYKWMVENKAYEGEETPEAMLSTYFSADDDTGAVSDFAKMKGDELTEGMPMVVKIVSQNAVSGSTNLSAYTVSGSTYTEKACATEGTSCDEEAYVWVVQYQHEAVRNNTNEVASGVQFFDKENAEGQEVQYVRFPAQITVVDKAMIDVSAEVEGNEDSGIKSVTLPTIEKTGDNEDPKLNEVSPGVPATLEMVTPDPEKEYGLKASHVAAEFGFGAVTGFVGYSQVESNESGSMKDKITHYGVRGSLGESGVGFLVQLRSEDLQGSAPMDADRDPYLFRMSKSLGDGASVYLEHANNDVKGGKAMTGVGLVVDF